MQYSIIIPVYKRNEIILSCLNSIASQTLKPYEIIIVDNNVDINQSEKLNKLLNDFNEKYGFRLRTLKTLKNSGAIARNLGAQSAKTKYVAFLDSDVVLDKNYYSVLFKYFIENEELVAAQGLDQSLVEFHEKISNFSFLKKIFYSLEQFFETSLLFNKTEAYVSPSLAVAHPNVLNEFEVFSQWISTCAGLFKKELFDKYSFPNQFITYSNNEYLYFSYNLFRENEGKMIYTSKAKYRDIQTNSGRIDMINLMYQIQVYDLYIFLKLFNINLKNISIFIKSRIGHLIINTIKLMYKKDVNLIKYFHVIFSIVFPIINLKSILNDDLSFYERNFPIN